MGIHGTHETANLTNIALHFYAGEGYLNADDAVTEPCAAYGEETLYRPPPSRSVHLRTVQRKFDGHEESDSLEAHTHRIEAAVRSKEGQVCPLES